MFLEISDDILHELLTNNEKVMVQYSASWCGNCKITKPKFKRMSEENEDIAFYYVDAEKFPNSRKFASVTNLPTFAAFKNGTLVKEMQGNKLETIQSVLDALADN